MQEQGAMIVSTTIKVVVVDSSLPVPRGRGLGEADSLGVEMTFGRMS